ncbi:MULTISPECIES: mannose-1-phosphate guanylyltransferase [unclassified Lentimicrobium]|uniref:mannose-1-phosphate guanylyltransferase n=1 Tax=unclassified Lentimicrobium TaxID=2677434 RepID=UPI0015534DEE|nr:MULTISPECIES: mannose-1-phosphate guanylyltransferase [unclassified Lentimicrobium]NPD47872.1 mannose-1-phosphate guanylyltransferase [Lentimicrobium sp. S6]NPD83545.1 mannose-1-phosphate guanylyltransferase [Lentimicrobium sp. L6]NPD85966.1 mannose-1-phosphate guanylyltransferase [Lentimicrobium sp. L6]
MNKNNFCVIMAGGIGSRFWPMSRTTTPKQFIDVLGTGETLIQQTVNRFRKVCPIENIYVVTNDLYREMVKEQIPDMEYDQILCEPARRNTAPCIAYANYKIQSINPNANIVVAPSDHIILKEDVFVEVIKSALEATANNDWLITLGIEPSRPDTGYGYIQFDKNLKDDRDGRIHKVKTFTEKPKLELAKEFLKSGDFLWNAGIFVWSLKSIQKAFDTHLADVSNIFKEGMGMYNTEREELFIENAYSICKNISIDYGVMESAENVYVLSSDFGWSDLGTWGSLYAIRDKDENENTILGKNVMTYDTKNSIVNVKGNRLVVLQGLDDYIVVDEDNILLVCKKTDEQSIKTIVNDVKATKGDKFV